jgi:hypothetical protein
MPVFIHKPLEKTAFVKQFSCEGAGIAQILYSTKENA